MTYRVRVKAEATMLVEVKADSEAEAKRVARQLDWEPLTDWEPEDYSKVRAVAAWKPNGNTDTDN